MSKEQQDRSRDREDLVRGLPKFSAASPEALAKERAELAELRGKGLLTRWRGYFAKSGPGWLQSALVLGSGSAMASLFAGAFLLKRVNAFMMGVFTPLISAVLTGMPPFYPPIAFVMSVQLGIVCYAISHITHSFKLRVILTLIIAIVIDRLLLVLFYYLIIPLFHINYGIYTAYDLVKCFPGIVLIVILVPVLVPRAIDVLNRYSLRLYEDKKEG